MRATRAWERDRPEAPQTLIDAPWRTAPRHTTAAEGFAIDTLSWRKGAATAPKQ